MITLPPATRRSAYGAPQHTPRPKPDSRLRVTTCQPGTSYRLRLDRGMT